MRSYEEMADNILEKYNARLEQKKRRKAIIMRTAVSLSGLCAAAIVGLFIWHDTALTMTTAEKALYPKFPQLCLKTSLPLPIQ